MTEDEMVGWHNLLNGHEFEQTLADSEGQGSLAFYSLWGYKGQTQLSDRTTTKQKHRRIIKDMANIYDFPYAFQE